MSKKKNHVEDKTIINLSKYLMYVETTETNSIKSLFECLKDALTDANLTFSMPFADDFIIADDGITKLKPTKEQQLGGISLYACNPANNVYTIKIILPADNFQTFKCVNDNAGENQIIKRNVGIGFPYANRVLKFLNSESKKISFGLKKKDVNRLIVTVKGNGDQHKIYITTIDLNDTINKKLDFKYAYAFTYPLDKFHKSLKTISDLTKELSIQLIPKKKKFRFIFQGTWSAHKYDIFPNESNPLVSLKHQEEKKFEDDVDADDQEETIIGTYPIEILSYFSKLNQQACPNVDIFMHKDYPIVLRYRIAKLGDVYFSLQSTLSFKSKKGNKL